MNEQIPVLRFRDVSIQTHSNVQLTNINFQVNAGETHAVIAMSGLEIQALISAIYKDVRIFRGMHMLAGKVYEKKAVHELYDKVDLIDSTTGIYPSLSVFDNVNVKKKTGGFFIREEIKRKIQELFQSFSIPIDVSQRMQTLTREEQGLVQLMGAYVSEKPLVVINELESRYGRQYQDIRWNIIKKIKEQGRGIIYLTSMLESALMISDRISVLSEGRIRMTKETTQVIEDPREIIYLLAGWSPISETDQQADMNILSTLITARDLLTTTSELKNELAYLADDIAKVFQAHCCSIYLIDSEAGRWISTSSNEVYRASEELILKLMQQQDRQNSWVEITKDTEEFQQFFADSQIQSMICVPVNSGNNFQGIIQLMFEKPYQPDDRDRFYMDSFCKEISIAIETSRLIGRSMLLQESHHRIKNNLQMINSLIYLQKSAVRKHKTDPDEAFDAITRMVSSIAAVHDILAKDTSNNSIINLRHIIAEIVSFYRMSDLAVTVETQNISIPYNKAVNIALIVNEIINNSVKHAFADADEKRVSIICESDGLQITIRIQDNGSGFRMDQAEIEKKSIGMGIVRNLVSSMKGEMQMHNDGGACVEITIPVSHVYDGTNSI